MKEWFSMVVVDAYWRGGRRLVVAIVIGGDDRHWQEGIEVVTIGGRSGCASHSDGRQWSTMVNMVINDK